VVRAPHVAPPSRSTSTPTGTFVSAHHAESFRTRVLRSSSAQSPIDLARAIVPRRTSAHVVGGPSTHQGPQTSGRTKQGGSVGGGQ
jgi:hypothetical protein